MSLDLHNLKSQKILILGLGIETLEFLLWAKNKDYLDLNKIYIADKNPNIIEKNQKLELPENNYLLGDNYLSSLKIFDPDLVIKSPGIWSLLEELEEFRKQKGEDKIISSLYFFVSKFRDRIIGVTGTKGKTTTCTLINQLLTYLGIKNYYCGNSVGISPYNFFDEFEKNNSLLAILEMSSFQLQDLGFSQISPKFSIITNLFIDHLDQHQKVEEYWLAKANIFKYQKNTDVLITYNETIDKLNQLKLQPKKLKISFLGKISFLENRYPNLLLGHHNYANFNLALDLVNLINDQKKLNLQNKLDDLTNFLLNFSPPEHRLQKVYTIKRNSLEVNFFDDGSATEAEAVSMAILALTKKENEYCYLFISGKDKGVNIDNLLNVIKDNQKKILGFYLTGKIGDRLLTKLKELKNKDNFDFKYKFNQSLKILTEEFVANFEKEIIAKNNHLIKENTIINIALSPLGSSFDEFQNYLERSSYWTKNIKSILA